ncbi:hypothetical protein FKW77_001435 [Venturia effusa]|uniref:Glutamine-dependent NAD(+) synthetase n=1 Tax=Venturia effusa TaxID=50376 RepID=A0A517KVU2_9PEZI|nr:hypothetical protein FKW77_001435 [Venturia effusa]
MGHLITVATCSLRQWSTDYEGNTHRIIQSIKKAKEAGARVRVGSELEICGYGCADHFREQDLYLHCWEMLERIMCDKELYDIVVDVGMPIQHRNVRYNCRVIMLNGKILLIRPKMWLANDGNYFEMRHFTPWTKPREIEQYHLPRRISKLQGASHVLFGDAVISTPDTCIGAETCEELFTPDSPSTQMSLDGVEIFTNSSGSHFELRKLHTRLELIQGTTKKMGGCYLYANQSGCDGDRVLYDGSAMIVLNGEIVAQGSQFSLDEVEVVTATIDLEEIRAYRSAASRGMQAAASRNKYQRIQTAFELSDGEEFIPGLKPSLPTNAKYHSPEEQMALSGGVYLYDYLTRSGMSGYLVPLSGGIDSCATAVMVYSMCRLMIEACEKGNETVIAHVKRIATYSKEMPKTANELCNQIFHTMFMGMEKQSSEETRGRAKNLASKINAYHVDLNIDAIFEAQKGLIAQTHGFQPKFKVHGGSNTENLMLQNIQARTRMITAYQYASTLPMIRNRPNGGSLLVLGSANVAEALRGYFTKYDCSSADINPIGSIDKADLRRLITWAGNIWEMPILHDFVDAVPTAELEPITDTHVQSDEADMGITYAELTAFGKLRKVNKLGPYGCFRRLLEDWSIDRPKNEGDDAPRMTPREIAQKTKFFFHYYAINRHKMTTITPSMHANDYSPDDNRFDMRPFLYPPSYQSWSYKKIDEYLELVDKARHD